MSKILYILGTSRANGNTRQILDIITESTPGEFIDLTSLDISPYDYDHGNGDDDFLAIAEKMVDSDAIVFATPVYWYAMSTQMKTFFDRFSDLVRVRKDLGRALKGKRTYLVVSGSDVELPDGYEVPFRRSSEYLDMEYQSAFYFPVAEDLTLPKEIKDEARKFAGRIN